MIRRSNTPEIWLKAPFYRASKLAMFLPLVLLTSCAFLQDTLKYIDNMYTNDVPFTISEYNELTGEKPRLKLKGYEDIDLKISTEQFYIRKTIKLTDFYLDSGKKFKESEERRFAKKEILTLH